MACTPVLSCPNGACAGERDLKPENMVMFNDTLSWKLIDFGSWAKRGATSQLEYTLRYAAPELLGAHATEDVVQVMPSIDMWALGLIFWEVLTGDPLLGEEYDKEEVLQQQLMNCVCGALWTCRNGHRGHCMSDCPKGMILCPCRKFDATQAAVPKGCCEN